MILESYELSKKQRYDAAFNNTGYTKLSYDNMDIRDVHSLLQADKECLERRDIKDINYYIHPSNNFVLCRSLEESLLYMSSFGGSCYNMTMINDSYYESDVLVFEPDGFHFEPLFEDSPTGKRDFANNLQLGFSYSMFNVHKYNPNPIASEGFNRLHRQSSPKLYAYFDSLAEPNLNLDDLNINKTSDSIVTEMLNDDGFHMLSGSSDGVVYQYIDAYLQANSDAHILIVGLDDYKSDLVTKKYTSDNVVVSRDGTIPEKFDVVIVNNFEEAFELPDVKNLPLSNNAPSSVIAVGDKFENAWYSTHNYIAKYDKPTDLKSMLMSSPLRAINDDVLPTFNVFRSLPNAYDKLILNDSIVNCDNLATQSNDNNLSL